MKKFYISLLGSALISIIVLGWLIDAFSQQTHTPQDEFYNQTQMIKGFAKQLVAMAPTERERAIKQLNSYFNVQLEYRPTQSLALPHSLLQQITQPNGLILEDQQGYYLLYSEASLGAHHLKMRLGKDPIHDQGNDVLLTLLFYAGLCVFMGFIITPLAKRLTVLNEAAKRFAKGDLSSRIHVSHFTYIRDVELTFNRMASQIEKLLDENKLMASSLSHDIRTPIACLRFGLEAAQDCPNEEKRLEYLARMEQDLDQMESMLKSYLAFATLEQKANQLTFNESDLHSYLLTVIHQVEPKLEQRALHLEHDIKTGYICADLHWLARAIVNLLSNACDFAHSDILITAHCSPELVVINVEDDGPGVNEQNWHKVFSPFFQEQTHRNRDGESYGLGLAIAAKVADWHHGTISVSKSKKLGGACFTLSIQNKSP
ncbi:ATP-binding protein [Pseudoalteromonas sp. PAB 2.2]|uniref:sensor histidine kinase n=1 Tax=Pseudoalteromonas sp. PAB 2.2 TaxID=1841508 RepID=UPI00094F91F4|nr:ATP-binding protein [Pseudoalteromonas sp. PAB 2.2]